jgi:dihydropteroate synthase
MTERRHAWHLADQTLTIGARPLLLGILNVTPDSFSDGGRFQGEEAAVARGLELVAQGADLLDIGGESSRPGAAPVPVEEELSRVVPIVERLAAQTRVPISVDTTKAAVAAACLAAGARIVNDITALGGDSEMAAVVRDAGAGVILMHMQGTPATMQQNPQYGDAVDKVRGFLEARLQALADLGIGRDRVVVDPGVGFGKTVAHNLEIVARLDAFGTLGRPVCLGVSRKGFLGKVLGRPLEHRLAGSLAAVAYVLHRGAVQVVRVHDVEETRDLLELWERLEESRG